MQFKAEHVFVITSIETNSFLLNLARVAGPIPDKNIIISLDRNSYKPEEEIVVSYVNGSTYSNAWIGLYKEGAKDLEYKFFTYLNGKVADTLKLKAPKEEGRYQYRMFKDGGYINIGNGEIFTVDKDTVVEVTTPPVIIDLPVSNDNIISFPDLPSNH